MDEQACAGKAVDEQACAGKAVDEQASALPDARDWGLDPTFWCFKKLSNLQILMLPEHNEHTWCYIHGNRVVSKVQVLGDVVSVHERERNVHFCIDDGSAVLPCVLWKNRDDLDWEAASQGLELGKVVCVMGKISDFREERQLSVTSWRIVSDVHALCMHWLSIVQLDRDVYSIPAVYSNHVPEAPAAQAPSVASSAASGFVGALEKHIRGCGEEGKRFTFHQILEETDMRAEALDALKIDNSDLNEEQVVRLKRFVASSLRKLVCSGVVFQSDVVTDEYCVLSTERHVVPVVRAVLRNACSHGNEDMSEAEIAAAVRGQPTWMHATEAQVRAALHLCTARDYAYDVGGGRYRPV